MRFFWVLALCAGVCAQNTVEGTGSGLGTSYMGWSTAAASSISFGTNLLGGIEGTISNPNGGATVSCFTLDGTGPATNGDGKSCANGFPSQLAENGGGYFNLVRPATVKVVAGVAGQLDSAVNTYNPAVPQWTIQASSFGFQCGAMSDCKGSGNTVVWPTSTALPHSIRLHDSNTQWSIIQPTSGSSFSWSYLDQYLALIATHQPMVTSQTFTGFPCWAQTQPYTCPNSVASYGNNTNLVPSDLTASGSESFNNFVTAFVQHCTPGTPSYCVKDYIKVYEMWNEIDLNVHMAVPNHGCTTIAQCYQQLYYMVAPAVGIIRANVPNAVITTPSMAPGTIGSNTDVLTWLSLENTLGRISDFEDWHLYLTSGGMTVLTPEYQWARYMSNPANGFLAVQDAAGWGQSGTIDSETNYSASSGFACPMAGNLATIAVGNGGSGYNVGDYFSISQAGASGGWGAVVAVNGTAATLAIIEAVGTGYTNANGLTTTDTTTPSASGMTVNVTTGTYSEPDCAGMIARLQILHNAAGVMGDQWYKWVGTIGNGPTSPYSYATVYSNLQSMLIGGYFTGAAESDGMSPATWSAPFVEAGGKTGLWLWTDSEAGVGYVVPAGYSDYRDLLGNTTAVTAGGSIALTTVPILLE